MSNSTKSYLTIAGICISSILALTLLLSIFNINWGQISVVPAATVTVSGSAKSQVSHQIASFNASVTSTNDDKQTAIDQVNAEMDAILTSVKEFGIDDADVTTQNLSVYQEERYNPDQQESQVTGWRATNSITITLRNIDQASELNDLLTQTNATTVSGPNFMTDDTQTAEADLVADAIANARKKAEAMAQASGNSLGGVISVTEGEVVSQPVSMLAMEARDVGGIPAPIEPGSATISQSVTVVFELN